MERTVQNGSSTYSLPPHEGRFPVLCHPNFNSLHAQAADWLPMKAAGRVSDGHLQELLHNKVGLLVCRLYPNSPVDQRSLTLLKLVYWIVCLDDLLDDDASVSGNAEATQAVCVSILEAFFKGSLHDIQTLHIAGGSLDITCQPYNWMLLEMVDDWWREMLSGMPPSQQACFTRVFSEYVLVHVRMARFREQREIPSLQEYSRLRLVSSAMNVSFIMTEYDLGIELDPETLSSPLIQQLQLAVANHIAWLNDYFSFAQENRRQDNFNLLAVLHHRNNTSCSSEDEDGGDHTREPCKARVHFQQAVLEAWEMIMSVEEECAQISAQIKDSPHLCKKPGLIGYVDTICSQTSSHWLYSTESPRYYNIEHSHMKQNKTLCCISSKRQQVTLATTKRITTEHDRGPQVVKISACGDSHKLLISQMNSGSFKHSVPLC